MKRLLLSMLLVTFGGFAFSQNIRIIPEPESVIPTQEAFVITSKTNIVANDPVKAQKTIAYLNDYLKKYYPLSLQRNTAQKNYIAFRLTSNGATIGSYTLDVAKDSIVISSGNEEGLFYGMQTLIQLLPTTPSSTLTIPGVVIKDAPHMTYRGMMLDCGRNFMPVDFVKKFIDYLALHKFNSFHWHLTEDQGWRIEIKKYPRLTEVGAWRNGTIIGNHPGTGNTYKKTDGFYTQKEIKEVVKYAADRYITVLPEIEMPGHSSAAIAAYPQLSCFPDSSTEIQAKYWAGTRTGKQVQQSWGVYKDIYAPTEYTFHFIENVLDEVIKLFPSKYIHIGGDEAEKDYWNESPYCKQLMKNLKLKNADELQSYFIQRVEKYVNSKGREIIGWDEILDGGIGGLSPNATIMSWRGEDGSIAAAQQHHNVIMSPFDLLYFDHQQLPHEDSITFSDNQYYLPLDSVYSYNPVPAKLSKDEQKYIIGMQANVWTEYITNPRKVEYMVFPRIAALAEDAWTKPQNKNYDDFKSRMQSEIARYKLWGVNYCTQWNQPDRN